MSSKLKLGFLVVYNQLTMHHVFYFTLLAFTRVLHDVVVKSRQHLRLCCQLSSLPTHPYTVTWTKNKKSIETDDNIRIINDRCTLGLDIASTETSDTAKYHCTVTCASRRITCSAYVAVLGKRLSKAVWPVVVTSAVFGKTSDKKLNNFWFYCPVRSILKNECLVLPKRVPEVPSILHS